ncbi:hypothetical protein J4475_03520 [Candidatus Woesearchaeota archaeon]|nr:hypothetical protein [Candidatus Woesearchaeota archaeon]
MVERVIKAAKQNLDFLLNLLILGGVVLILLSLFNIYFTREIGKWWILIVLGLLASGSGFYLKKS